MRGEGLEFVQWDSPDFKRHPFCFACYTRDPRVSEHRKCGHPGFVDDGNELPDLEKLILGYVRSVVNDIFNNLN